MIFTITCNPAIDKTIIDDKTSFTIGGKGINVSKALHNLKVDSIVTGFLGSDNKDLFINDLNSNDLNHHFIIVDGKSRTNTKRIINNELYEENEDGPIISIDKQNELLDYVSTLKNEIVIISGSAPSSVDSNYYELLINNLKKNNCYVILDSSKSLLNNGIKAIPNVIKPNKKEFCEIFNIEYDEKAVIDKSYELLAMGIENIIISLSEEGSLFINKDGVYKVKSLKLNYVSSLCAGDSMVAGIVYSKLNNLSYLDMIKFSTACASASVESINIFNSLFQVEDLVDKVEIAKII